MSGGGASCCCPCPISIGALGCSEGPGPSSVVCAHAPSVKKLDTAKTRIASFVIAWLLILTSRPRTCCLIEFIFVKFALSQQRQLPCQRTSRDGPTTSLFSVRKWRPEMNQG